MMLTKIPVLLFITVLFFLPSAYATTQIELLPSGTSVNIGDMFDIDIYADIDAADAIIAFGFDLEVSGTGAVTYNGFSPNSPTFDIDLDHLFLSDADGILGASDGTFFEGPAVSGDDILLGTLSFTAAGAGDVLMGLSADDLDFWYTEGLIPLDLPNFMPDVIAAEVTIASAPVPEPTTMLLLGTGLVGLVGLGRKKFFKK